MQIDKKAIQDRLRRFDFTGVFTQELGWDFPPGNLTLTVAGKGVSLQAVAEKKGLVAFVCPAQAGERLPDYATRRKIEREATKHCHQHLIIFTDAQKTTQVWQWVKRELSKPAACREHTYQVTQSGDALIQKLDALRVSLLDEERLTHVEVTGKVKKAFDVEKVTKRFYDRFQKEHAAFLKFLKGIPDEDLQRWYVSVMLNRLMFIYFIQSKGFLGDGDRDYLRTKLAESKLRGRDHYYREFLCPLFFEGFAKRPHERSAATNALLGTVPYLNGGLFLRHQIEELHGEAIRIPDAAFDKLFDFFHAYHWHLDERPLRADNEINPDVLGYIFEKYINQKQMGAYYTKEDITEYIAKNTIIPFLFDATAKRRPDDFAADAPIWRLLREDPDRYIYPAVRRGVVDDHGNVLPESALPDFVQKGMHDPKARMFDRRYNLGEADLQNPPSPFGRRAGGEGAGGEGGEKLTLPTETWREYVCRRQRCLELREKLHKAEVTTINDLITLNLDIRQFAQDAIANCQSPELLAAFFNAIRTVTVLDPTCGSGAFLFAALNILEPLYEACLDRMEAFLSPLPLAGEGPGVRASRPSPKQRVLDDFRRILKSVNDDHPNAKYFIFKSIIIQNLFGVDIMEEAVEICKLRLFLKLVAQVDPDPSKPNLGVEPLPDIDFNIRAGNTLVGYTRIDEIRRSQEGKLPFTASEIARLETQAKAVAARFDGFRRMQTNQVGHEVTPEELAAAKDVLRKLQAGLAEELNRYLAGEYGIDADNAKKAKEYEKWGKSHQPFHWFVEFHGIMHEGGFGVIIGNPPWVEKRIVQEQYKVRSYSTETTNNLYAYVTERSISLLKKHGRLGFIVPLSSMATGKFTPLQEVVLRQSQTWLSNYDDRPSRLFEALEHVQPTIILTIAGDPEGSAPHMFTTRCYKWSSSERPSLFNCISYAGLSKMYLPGSVPKVSTALEVDVLNRLWAKQTSLGCSLSDESPHVVYYTRKVHAFLNVLDFVPTIRDGSGRRRDPSEQKTLEFSTAALQSATLCALNSTLFRWFLATFSDCRNLNRREVLGFPIDLPQFVSAHGKNLGQLATRLSRNLQDTSEVRAMRFGTQTLRVQCIIPKHSKDLIDQIEEVLADYYGFSSAELDFLVNYDIKYRMRQDDEGESEE